MMYRPPEMIDKYKRFNVSCKVDVWMLGCVAYTLVYAQHPFVDCQKLAICNAGYQFPQNHAVAVPEKLKDLIRLCLVADPEQRPNVPKLLSVLDNYHMIPSVNLTEAAMQVK